MVMRRYGRLATLFWTQVKQLKFVDFRSVYLFMRRLAFGISIHGRRYVCTYIESICWYLYYFTIFRVGDSDSIFGHSNAVPHCFLRVCF